MSDEPGPHFDQPPVSEVALALYFDSPLLRTVDVGLLWEQWRDRYPIAEDQPPFPPVPVEQFGRTPSFALSINFTGTYPGTRALFQSRDRDRVVQVQQDRLILNWRRTAADRPYPRYEALRPEFLGLVEELDQFGAGHDLGPIGVAQVEVTYSNPVPLDAIDDGRAVECLIAPWSGSYSDEFLPSPERLAMSASYVISKEGSERGRLYVQAQPAIQSQPAAAPPGPVYLLQVFARCPATAREVAAVPELLDLGHHWVVNGFASLTTTTMHALWGRRSTS